MKFLVILICLALNHFWLREHDRFDDRWFFRFRENMETAVRRLAGDAAPWQATLALVYLLPLLLLLLVLRLVDGSAFGLPTMLVHILIVLIAFDRTQPGRLSREFIALWSKGDQAAVAAFLQRNFRGADDQQFADAAEAGPYFRKHLVYRFFERMFVQFFWYIAAGPAGVLISYVSYQLRDSAQIRESTASSDSDDEKAAEDEADEEGEENEEQETPSQTHPGAVETIETIVHLLEWIPLRLVALSFSLTGNFVHCFAALRKSFLEFGRQVDNAGLLYNFADLALFGGIPRNGTQPEQSSSDHQTREIESLQALLERCQLLWLGLLALFTVFSPAI